MHERRNFVLVLFVAGGAVWAFIAWLMLKPDVSMFISHRAGSVLLLLSSSAWLFHGLVIADKAEDHLRGVVGDMYYECDGLSFMPMIRVRSGQAELCVYYQNRFENPVQTIVHLRPPADSFVIRPGVRDVHFAFKASGGDFGAIHQPIAVPAHLQGEVITVQLAAASFYPRSHGARLRKHAGIPVAGLLVDWGGAAFKTGVHEVSGEIELHQPVTLHWSMPSSVNAKAGAATDQWRQEQLAAGAAA